MKQYIVIGAGRFGKSLAKTLMDAGQEVMVIDNDENTIQQLAEEFDNLAIVNATDETALKSIGLGNFDVAIIAIGANLRSSIMATVLAKDLGVPLVISKAQDKLQEQVLKKVGADKVVFPEHDMGVKLAKSLMFDNLVDYIELDQSHSIFEIRVPKQWVGKNLLELEVRDKYRINVVAVKRNDQFHVPPNPTLPLASSDIIVIAGKTKVIENIALMVAKETKNF